MLLLSTLDYVNRWSPMNPCGSCGVKMLGLFHKPKWVHYPNLVKMYVPLILLLIIGSSHHTFSHVTTAQLLWHIKKYDSNWTVLHKIKHICILQDAGYELLKSLWNVPVSTMLCTVDIQNHMKIIFAAIMVIQSWHNFAYVMIAQLPWHVQK